MMDTVTEHQDMLERIPSASTCVCIEYAMSPTGSLPPLQEVTSAGRSSPHLLGRQSLMIRNNKSLGAQEASVRNSQSLRSQSMSVKNSQSLGSKATSMGRTRTFFARSGAWAVGLHEGFQRTLSILERENLAKQSNDNDSRTCWSMLPKFLLCMYPLFLASRSLGFTWARERSLFSPVSALLASSMVLMLLTFAAMLLTTDTKSWRLMLSKKYLWHALPAFFYVAVLVSQFNALTLVHPAIMTTLMQTSSFMTAFLQYIIFKRLPHCAQAAALIGVNLLACSYTLGGIDSADVDSEVVGILLTLGAACSRAPFALAMEYVGTKTQHAAENVSAERLRGMIAIEFWKVLFFALCLFTDHRFIVENGFFHGWDWNFLVAVVSPSVVVSMTQAIILPACGALRTNVAASMEMVVVYSLQVTVLQIGDLETSELFLLMGLVAAVVTYNVCVIDVARAETSARLSLISTVRNSQSKIADGSSAMDALPGSMQSDSTTHMGMHAKNCATQFPEIVLAAIPDLEQPPEHPEGSATQCQETEVV